MRDIKFRAWDTFNHRMVIDPYFFRAKQDFHEFDCDFDHVYYDTWQDVDDGIERPCFMMQYVGQKDKNGKEIYEGDIVKTNRFAGVQKGFIEYRSPEFMVINPIDGISWAFTGAQNCEVLGNIYENTELLEIK